MLEIACFELTSAEMALRTMADRIEFCSNFELGGTTPDYYEFLHLKRNFLKPIYVMIRPKGGVFYYTDEEFQKMKFDIQRFRDAGANGFVFGILDSHNEIDVRKNRDLIELAGDVPCTFHRAFDRTSKLEKSAETLINLGLNNILTSGGKATAWEGKETLKYLIDGYSHKINILIGGGVRSENIAELKEFTGGNHFHSSAIKKYDTFASEEEIRKLKKLIS